MCNKFQDIKVLPYLVHSRTAGVRWAEREPWRDGEVGAYPDDEGSFQRGLPQSVGLAKLQIIAGPFPAISRNLGTGSGQLRLLVLKSGKCKIAGDWTLGGFLRDV